MKRGLAISWRDVRVDAPLVGDHERRRVLEGHERLAALYRLQSGELASDARFANIEGPGDVDWDGFPLVAAIEAVTRDEVRRLSEVAYGWRAGSPRLGC